MTPPATCSAHEMIKESIDKLFEKAEKNALGINGIKTTLHVWFVVLTILIPSTTWVLMNGLEPVLRKAEAYNGTAGIHTEYPRYIGESIDISSPIGFVERKVSSPDKRTTNPHDLDYVGVLQ